MLDIAVQGIRSLLLLLVLVFSRLANVQVDDLNWVQASLLVKDGGLGIRSVGLQFLLQQQQHRISRPNFCWLTVHPIPTWTVLWMLGRADMGARSHWVQTDPNKDVGIKHLWTRASRFLTPVSFASTLTSVRNMTVPVAPWSTVGAVMGCHVGVVLVGYQDTTQ